MKLLSKQAPQPAPVDPVKTVEPVAKKNHSPVLVKAEDIKVIKNYGIPPRTRSGKGASKYPIVDLEIGDAIKGDARLVRGAAVAARAFRYADPLRKFSSFKLDDGQHVLVRIE